MTLVVTHPYVSSIAESTASGVAGGLVGPNEWNANHTLTGVAAPSQGGTGITSGTGVTYFSSATVIADSGTLTLNAVVLGGGANGAPTVVGTVGTTSQVLFGGTGGGAPQWAAAPSGGGTPGGAATDVQFASSGSTFSGDSSFTYAGAGAGVTIKLSSSTSTAGISALSIVTSSSSNMASNSSALNITSLWNNSGTVYDAPLFMNITNTASANGSALMDLQVGGASGLTFGIVQGGTQQVLALGPLNSSNRGFRQLNNEIEVVLADGSAYADFKANNINVGIDLFLGGRILFPSNDIILIRDGAGILAERNGTNAQTLRIYNTFTDASNYERGVIDWNTTANTLTVAAQAAGTGTLRNLQLVYGGANINFCSTAGGADIQIFGGNIVQSNGGVIGFSSNKPVNNLVASLGFVTSKVISIGDGGQNANGWYNWAGESRVSANSTTTSTALANVPGLAFKPLANRNYSFEAHLIFTDSATGGIQCTVNATSTTTTYTLTFDGWVTDTVAVRGYAQGSAFGNVVASSLTTSTVAHVTITGTLMTSATAPSTVTIQFAQNTSNATPTTILIGSYMWAQDMP